MQANISNLLHAIIIPTSKSYLLQEGTKKKIICKTSIKTAQDSFLKRVNSASNLKTELEKITNNAFEIKGKLQPLMVCVGPNMLDLNEFYVYFYPILYKCETFAKCIDTCFKIYMVLNLKYPIECELVWTFIQKFFFNIQTEFDKRNSQLITVTNELKNYLSKTTIADQ